MIQGSRVLDRLFSIFETGEAKIKADLGNVVISSERPQKQITSFTHNTLSSSGTIPSGKYSVTFKFSNDFEGALQGTSVVANEIIAIETDYNSVLPEINYTIVSGSIRVLILEP